MRMGRGRRDGFDAVAVAVAVVALSLSNITTAIGIAHLVRTPVQRTSYMRLITRTYVMISYPAPCLIPVDTPRSCLTQRRRQTLAGSAAVALWKWTRIMTACSPRRRAIRSRARIPFEGLHAAALMTVT